MTAYFNRAKPPAYGKLCRRKKPSTNKTHDYYTDYSPDENEECKSIIENNTEDNKKKEKSELAPDQLEAIKEAIRIIVKDEFCNLIKISKYHVASTKCLDDKKIITPKASDEFTIKNKEQLDSDSNIVDENKCQKTKKITELNSDQHDHKVCRLKNRRPKSPNNLKTDGRKMTGNVNIYICSEANENKLNANQEIESSSEKQSEISTASISTNKLVNVLKKQQQHQEIVSQDFDFTNNQTVEDDLESVDNLSETDSDEDESEDQEDDDDDDEVEEEEVENVDDDEEEEEDYDDDDGEEEEDSEKDEDDDESCHFYAPKNCQEFLKQHGHQKCKKHDDWYQHGHIDYYDYSKYEPPEQKKSNTYYPDIKCHCHIKNPNNFQQGKIDKINGEIKNRKIPSFIPRNYKNNNNKIINKTLNKYTSYEKKADNNVVKKIPQTRIKIPPQVNKIAEKTINNNMIMSDDKLKEKKSGIKVLEKKEKDSFLIWSWKIACSILKRWKNENNISNLFNNNKENNEIKKDTKQFSKKKLSIKPSSKINCQYSPTQKELNDKIKSELTCCNCSIHTSHANFYKHKPINSFDKYEKKTKLINDNYCTCCSASRNVKLNTGNHYLQDNNRLKNNNVNCHCNQTNNKSSFKNMICVYCDKYQDQCVCDNSIEISRDICRCSSGTMCSIINSSDDMKITKINQNKNTEINNDHSTLPDNRYCQCHGKSKPYGSDKLPYQKLNIFSNVMNELRQKINDRSTCCNECSENPCCCKRNYNSR